MAEKSKTSKEKVSEDLKKLVIARLDIIPSDKRISIGSAGEFTKTDLIERVRRGDAVGQKVVELDLAYLRALKDGTLLKEIIARNENDLRISQ